MLKAGKRISQQEQGTHVTEECALMMMMKAMMKTPTFVPLPEDGWIQILSARHWSSLFHLNVGVDMMELLLARLEMSHRYVISFTYFNTLWFNSIIHLLNCAEEEI